MQNGLLTYLNRTAGNVDIEFRCLNQSPSWSKHMTDIMSRVLPKRGQPTIGTHRRVLVADLSDSVAEFPQQSIVYLATPHMTESETVGAICRSVSGKLRSIDLPWRYLRNPRYRDVPVHISSHCWAGTDEESESVLNRVLQKCLPPVDDFSPQIDFSGFTT